MHIENTCYITRPLVHYLQRPRGPSLAFARTIIPLTLLYTNHLYKLVILNLTTNILNLIKTMEILLIIILIQIMV